MSKSRTRTNKSKASGLPSLDFDIPALLPEPDLEKVLADMREGEAQALTKMLADMHDSEIHFFTCPMCKSNSFSVEKPELIDRLEATAKAHSVSPSDLTHYLLTAALNQVDAGKLAIDDLTPKGKRKRTSRAKKR